MRATKPTPVSLLSVTAPGARPRRPITRCTAHPSQRTRSAPASKTGNCAVGAALGALQSCTAKGIFASRR